MDALTPAEQRELGSRLERRQMTEFMTTFSGLVQTCFDDCVNDFTSKATTPREQGCVSRCFEKHMKATERLGERFQEQNAAMQAEQGLR
ncbi:mitochondrial import inner membrane translocase subunit tim9 [Capronia coronata CBS 617.96]|uniref:Mitochondrial import inner membrane translocase subunit n=1 Tax=Capronia coronata CBS 617.96 TaxID=1182541 RepID=W9Y1Q8_9EURO|nr:mitochondrial import inner membrane translocase subunit tim9 [Capronia coronata CBS 617.96]EXJ83181.1 mitochondrial import inner membrane translocase subunit tim9 [Capronia coronata CBS 617.96]